MRNARGRVREAPLPRLPEVQAQGDLVKWLGRVTGSLVVTLAVLMAPPLSAQETPKSDEKPKTEKPKKKTLEDAIARAIRLARRKVDNQKLVLSTVLQGTLGDDDVYIVVCEFGTGDVAIFTGGLEPESDQWVFIEKAHGTALE